MSALSATSIGVMILGSLAAGWVDAVVGGGGLILVPLIMIMNPGFTNAQALGVNKVAGIFGTSSAAVVLASRVPSARVALRFAPLALAGAAGGALVASLLDRAIMRPIIIFALVAVGIFVAVRPQFGQASVAKRPTAPVWLGLAALIALIGFYDGAFGPGTGMFLILCFTTLIGLNFAESAAWAKVLNVATNLGALLMFAAHGEVLWLLGLGLAVANVIGAQVGARMVLAKGAGFVRAVILVVVVVMAAKLAMDQFGFALV
nr:TSUP family transporter [Corynebacterium lactis]